MVFLKRYFGIIAVIFLSFWAVKPLFIPGFFPIHDDTQVARVFEMGKALRDGMFPVRWASDLGYGYGYPIFNFYAPLSYYFGGFLILLGFDALIATKLTMIFGIVLAGVFMYLLAREFWGELGGVLSGLFYTYAPYHALDIYVRGDVSEFWAYAFIPLMFWGFYKVFKKGEWKYVIIGSLGYAGVILSHNLTAMMVTPFLILSIIIFSYISYKNKSVLTIYYLLLTTILGLALSAFYWIPALAELRYTNILSQIGGGADFRDHFICFFQLWESPWGFGGSAPGCIDGFSLKIGKLHLISSFISLSIALFFINKAKKNIGLILLLLFGFILSLIFTLEISKPIWEFFSLMEFFQFPWRFLLLVSLFSSLLSGLAFIFLKGKLKYFFAIFLGCILIYFNSQIFNPQTIFSRSASFYIDPIYLRWTVSQISDEYLPSNFIKPNNHNEVSSEIITGDFDKSDLIYEFKKTQKVKAIIDLKKDTKLFIQIAYYPAWNILVDGEKTSFKVLGRGLQLNLSQGKHSIDLLFQETQIEKITNILSFIAIVIVGIILFNGKFKQENE